MPVQKRILISSLIVCTISCGRPECRNNNTILDQFNYDSKEYKTELANQMQNIGKENLRYWYEKAYDKDGKYFVLIYIQGNGLCAAGEIQITDKSKFKAFRPKSGYSGSELKGVVLNTVQDSSGINFVLVSIDRIID